MIKKATLILLFVSCFINAQNTIEGFLSPNIDSDWLILYKIEGTQQIFVNNTTIKKESLIVNGTEKQVGTFTIQLPENAKPGAYRAMYRMEGQGFIDFYYNKEDVSFLFNPDYPKQSVAFSKSEENKMYGKYIAAITKVQSKLDSIQVSALQNPSLDLAKEYKEALSAVKNTQATYNERTKNMYIFPLVKASARSNPEEILTAVPDYLKNIKTTFFDKIDFTNTTLVNSSFITNRILDYIFYINYSDDKTQQQQLYKASVNEVLSKVSNKTYKRDIIKFLIDQFESSKNIELIDFLFEQHYNKLPSNLQENKYKEEKLALLAAEIGRIAPNFSWQENGKNYQLSSLNDASKYILVFWSTSCSHCLREIPQLYEYMKSKPNYKVIAFALENDAFVWEEYSKNKLQGWHNVLGLNKWENKTARTYQINSTPSYFVLDSNKKIIAKPYELKDVKEFIEN